MKADEASSQKNPFATDPVRTQYERFPYPPIPILALPHKSEGSSLRFPQPHAGIRILVVGCGTLEALVVAQAHLQAQEIIAVDFSQASLQKMQQRITWARWTRFPRRLPPCRFHWVDLNSPLPDSITQSKYNYILASNVLHHLPNPASTLQSLAQLLTSDGILRLVTYPQASRLWMRETSRWLRLGELHAGTPSLVRRAQSWIQTLPADHPIRLCYQTQPETRTATGIVDAFLNALENPLSPLAWQAAAENAGLTWIGESQTETSRSTFLHEVLPVFQKTSPWIKLQILDSLLELCANPIFWFKKTDPPKTPSPLHPTERASVWPTQDSPLFIPSRIPSRIFWEMKQNLLLCQELIRPYTLSLEELFYSIKREVGPRVHPLRPHQILNRMAMTDFDLNEILNTENPAVLSTVKLDPKKMERLQLRWGALQASIPLDIE